jgi:L-fuconolactonase
LKRNRFDGTVVVCERPAVEENRWLLGLAAEHEFIRGVVCGVELGDGALPALLDEYQRHAKFRGVYAEGGSAGELERRGLSLDLPPRFDDVARIAAAHSTLKIAIDHVGRPSLMQAGVEEFKALGGFPGICVKLSGLITDAPTQWKAAEFAPWARAALEAFGAERVMYGSDWPSYLPAGTWKEALAAFTQAIGAQSIETREQVLGATARRFYRLEDGV